MSLSRPCVIDIIERYREPLRHAVAQDCVTTEILLAAGIPHYHAQDLLRRLRQAGEISASDGRWQATYRDAYRDALAPPPQRALDLLAGDQRPQERALRDGIDVLSDHELLAVLLRTGGSDEGVLEMAARLLREHHGLVGLAGHDIGQLAQSRGLGPAKSTQLSAAFELGRRIARASFGKRPSMKTPEEVYRFLVNDLAPLSHEEFWCLPLDVRCRLIGSPLQISRGDIDGTDAGPRAFFRNALGAKAASCIAVHNHPSGQADPSAGDLAVTRRLANAGEILGCPLLDHIIIGHAEDYCSLRRTQPQLFKPA